MSWPRIRFDSPDLELVMVPNQTVFPRIDRIIESDSEIVALTGTPTRGATMENLHGAPGEREGYRTRALVLLTGVPLPSP